MAKTLEFMDESLVTSLYGEQDRNIKHIEQRTQVEIQGRGNKFAILGEDKAIHYAEEVLNLLYKLAKKRQSIHISDVEMAVQLVERLAANPENRDIERTMNDWLNETIRIETKKRTIWPRSINHAEIISSFDHYDMVFAVGPAGSGKTYLAVAKAVSMLSKGKVDRIIVSRPAVEAGEKLGFLPGDLKEKVDPYLRPIYDALYDMLPNDMVERYMENQTIEIAPLAFMRGRTLSNAFIVLDEAQNTTPLQMKMCLTRLGENSKIVVTGDLTQVDLPTGTDSGLDVAIRVLKNVEEIKIAHFDKRDIVRHPLVAKVVEAYESFKI